MNLSTYMQSKSLKDKHVAAELDVARSYVNQVRRGLREPSLRTAVAIERWSGGAITPAELLTAN